MPTFREDTKIGGMVPMMKTDDINDQAITKDKIRDGNVTAEKLADGAVSTDKLPDGAIKTPKIADGNITTSKLAEASVVTSKIADQNVTKEKIADHSVDNSKLSPEAVTYDKLKDKAIITEKLNDRAVTTEKVEEKAITNTKLGDQSVDGRVVREASLETKHFANESVTTEKVARKSITKDKLADNAVDSSQVVDGSIGNAKLSPDSVTTEKIKDGSVTNEKVADDTLGIEKFDSELRKTIQAATGLPEDLSQMIQDVDKYVKQLHEKDTDLQSQIDDKQQQIADNDDDISLLQTRSTQMEEAIKGISASGGASQATAVTYENTESGLNSITAQGAIDELANKKLNKENISQEFGDSKDKVVSQFALPFREIKSSEFIKAIVDTEDHFLFGIQLDGSIEWGKGIPAPIRTKLQEIINQCQKDKTDILEAINAAKEELSASITALQEGKVDKEEGKSLIEDEVKECFRIIENEEFLKAIVDSDDKVLFGFYRATGKPYYPLNEMYHVEQNEEFLWVILDAVNHPLLGIQQDGTCWAAKAQWLDDIKAIKKALKTFQPKEDGKGLINLDVADSFFYISNDEYIIAVVDAENRILAGIKYDGEPYFPNHEMYSVITNEEWLYAIIDAEDKVLGGFRADDGHMIVGGIDISIFIANAIVDVADIKERTAHLSTIENDEYLSVETDSDGKVIGYTAPDGSHYLYKVKSETIPTEFEHIEDPEDRTEITTDAEGKIISYRDSDGINHEEVGISTKSVVAKSSTFGAITFDTEEHKEAFVETLDIQKKNEVKIREFDLPKNGTVDIVSETFYLTANAGYSDLSGVYPIQILENNTTNAWNKRVCQVYYLKSSLKANQDGTYSLYNDGVSGHDIPLHFYASSNVKEENGVYIGTTSITKVNGVCYYTDTLLLDESAGRYIADAGSIKVVAQDEPVEQSTKTFSEQVTQLTDIPNVQAWSVNKKTEHNCVVAIDFGDYLTGNFFVKVKFQGSSTIRYPKRNFRLTFYKKKDYAKKLKIKIGEMPRLSGYNLKAFYPDVTRVREYTLNRIAFAIWENRSKGDLDYPWNKDGNFYTGATGMIKAFPAKVSLGGNFYGFELFGLKKDEKNYLLDGDDDTSGIFVSGEAGSHAFDARGWADEMGVDGRETAFPNLEDSVSVETAAAINSFFKYVIGTFKDSNNVEYEYYQLRKINEIFYVESTLTYDAATGTYSVNENSIATTRTISFSKDTAPEHMSIIDWIDYLIVAEVFYLADNFIHNIILYTGRDKKKFYPFLYDLDGSFNVSDWNLDALSRWDSNNNLYNDTFYGVFYDEFKDLLHNRYVELRKNILNSTYIKTVLDDIYSNIPEEWLTLEHQKWGNAGYKLYYTLEYLDKRLNWIDNNLFNIKN